MTKKEERMKTYKIKVNAVIQFLYNVKANNQKDAEEQALSVASDEYSTNDADYPLFEVVK